MNVMQLDRPALLRCCAEGDCHACPGSVPDMTYPGEERPVRVCTCSCHH